MIKKIAEIAGNRCPRCRELTRVPFGSMVTFDSNSFPCSACKGRLRVATRTRVIAFLGGLLGVAIWIWVYAHVFPWIDRAESYRSSKHGGVHRAPSLPVLIAAVAYFVAATPFGRLSLRLQPRPDSPRR